MAIAVIVAILYASFCFRCFSFASLYSVAAIQTTIIAMRIIAVRSFKEMVQMHNAELWIDGATLHPNLLCDLFQFQ